jgi:hypothetical protein
MNLHMKIFLYCCLVGLAISCKESYDPDFITPDKGYLVVEGVIGRTGNTLIKLSRTIKLAETSSHKNEIQAQVSVEGKDNSKFMLTETSAGQYTASLNLVAGQQYRLHIKTKEGKDYMSSYMDVKTTPAIDKLTWARENGDVQVYIHTHDPQNNTRYYRWEYNETWEFTSFYVTTLKYVQNPLTKEITGIDYRFPAMTPDYSVFTCWQSEASSRILIGTSAKLSQDVIQLPLLRVPAASWKISVLYSVLVKQYAITKEEYEFLNKMKKNTEETGSLFDPQPSELKGNIYCTTDASEPVIGFIGISDMKEKRLWISASEVPGWGYRQPCTLTDIPNNIDSIRASGHLEPTEPSLLSPFGDILRYYASDRGCVLCTTRGTNVKPSFWP